MKRTIVVVLAVIVWAATAAGAEPVELNLRYNPREAINLQQVIDTTITGVTMDKSALGIDGYAHGDLLYSRSPMDEQTQVFEMNLTLENVQQRVMQQVFDTPEKSETKVTVTALGAPQMKVEEDAETGPQILGIPIRLLAIFCHVIRFPEAKVRCGSEWSADEALDLPDLDPINLAIDNTFISITDGRFAVVESNVDAYIPYFETPNPMGYGGPMPVMEASMNVTDMQRVFDIDRSVVTEAKGTVAFSGEVDLGGQISHVTAEGTFELKIRPEDTDAAETSDTDTARGNEQASETESSQTAGEDTSKAGDTGADSDTPDSDQETDGGEQDGDDAQTDATTGENGADGGDSEDTGGADDTSETEGTNAQ